LCICHIPGDIEEVLEEPNPSYGKRYRVSLLPETDRDDEWKYQLAKRTAINCKARTDEPEEGVTSLVKQQVGAIKSIYKSPFALEDNENKDCQSNNIGREAAFTDRLPGLFL